MQTLSVNELIDAENDAWAEVREMLEKGKNPCTIASRDDEDAEDTLFYLQVSTRSYLGTVAYRTGGIVFDHGWIVLLGSGGAGVYGSLTSWNGLEDSVSVSNLYGMLVVAYDAAGGFFALDTGRYGRTGHIYYFAPDTLEWESTELAYSEFVSWLSGGDLGLFYETFRWEGWQEQLRQLAPGQVFAYYPPLWTEEGGGVTSSKVPVSVIEAWQSAADQKQ